MAVSLTLPSPSIPLCRAPLHVKEDALIVSSREVLRLPHEPWRYNQAGATLGDNSNTVKTHT